MAEFLDQIIGSMVAMSGWEYAAVALSVTYLFLAAKQSLWCWPAAFVSTLIYTILFYNGALLMDSALNVFYMIMAFYGWYSWRNQPLTEHGPHDELPIKPWSKRRHSVVVGVTLLVSMAFGFVMDNYTHADFAYLDSITTCYSVVATYLLARKVLENWLYWIVIDAISVYLYINKGFYLTSVLFMFYTTMAFWAYMQWQESMEDNEIEADESTNK